MNVDPSIDVTKVVDPASLAEPGGPFTYTVTIENTSVEPVTISTIADTGVTPLPKALADLIGTAIPAGGSVTATYEVTRTEAGDYPNTVSVAATDNEGNPATDSDDASVTVTDVEPTVTIDKSVDKASLPQPGGEFNFTIVIKNTSPNPSRSS